MGFGLNCQACLASTLLVEPSRHLPAICSKDKSPFQSCYKIPRGLLKRLDAHRRLKRIPCELICSVIFASLSGKQSLTLVYPPLLGLLQFTCAWKGFSRRPTSLSAPLFYLAVPPQPREKCPCVLSTVVSAWQALHLSPSLPLRHLDSSQSPPPPAAQPPSSFFLLQFLEDQSLEPPSRSRICHHAGEPNRTLSRWASISSARRWDASTLPLSPQDALAFLKYSPHQLPSSCEDAELAWNALSKRIPAAV